jgi:hypothetical protein
MKVAFRIIGAFDDDIPSLCAQPSLVRCGQPSNRTDLVRPLAPQYIRPDPVKISLPWFRKTTTPKAGIYHLKQAAVVAFGIKQTRTSLISRKSLPSCKVGSTISAAAVAPARSLFRRIWRSLLRGILHQASGAEMLPPKFFERRTFSKLCYGHLARIHVLIEVEESSRAFENAVVGIGI